MDIQQSKKRQDILNLCKDAEACWATDPGRNLVLFFDGTGNIIGEKSDTNVVKLMRAVDKTDPRQLVYYDPGVGTANEFPGIDTLQRVRNKLSMLKGLALGSGSFENIAEGYRFLAENYQPGDRIYLFGFSRGAFTARAVGGMVNMYGLVNVGALPLLPALVRTYFAGEADTNQAGKTRIDFASDIRDQFSHGRLPLIHFVGVWDTVETVGISPLGKPVSITNTPTIDTKRYAHVRHALALHETRSKYAPRLYDHPAFSAAELPHRSFEQRWFRGIHSDVGGSYAQAGLSDITLAWMATEAGKHGLKLAKGLPRAKPDAAQAMHDQTLASPFWAWTGLSVRTRSHKDTVDTSAQPLQAATPAQPMRRYAPTSFWTGVLLTLVVLAFAFTNGPFNDAACQRQGAPYSLVLAQLLSPFLASSGLACNTDLMARAIRHDHGFLLAYGLWLAYPVAWAVRRRVAQAVAAGKPLDAITTRAHWFMWGLIGADLLENATTLAALGPQIHTGWALLLAAFSAVKMLCIVLLLWVMARGLAR